MHIVPDPLTPLVPGGRETAIGHISLAVIAMDESDRLPILALRIFDVILIAACQH